jgi:hypothetical protein
MKTATIQVPPFLSVLFVALLLLPQFALSQDDKADQRPPYDSITTVFQHLKNYDQITIQTELDSLVQNKYRGKKQKAVITFTGEGQEPLRIKLSIEPRGVFRRRTCEIPPIKLDFIKSDLKKRGIYHKYDDVKLVTTCIDEPSRDQILQKEFWIYKMYNQVTHESFQVHPLKLIYTDLNDSTRTFEMRAFVIENTDEMAHRLNGEIVEQRGCVDSMLETTAYNRTLMFNYMIGNTDWDVKMIRNIKLVKVDSSEKLVVVPYDFDFTALVRPSYFRLVSSVNPNQVRSNRVALGSFSNIDTLRFLAQEFLQQQDLGFQCYENCTVLNSGSKDYMENYLEPFFKLLRKERRLKRVFLSSD